MSEQHPASKLTHIDSQGSASMVDITDKNISHREAKAKAEVCMEKSTLQLVINESGGVESSKGDVLGTARIAGIQAAKKTSDLIPLCHPLMLSSVKIEFELDEVQSKIIIYSRCKLAGKTGVEMEALTAASVAALTIYDMCKAVDKGIVISNICLLEKTGGKSGTWAQGSA